MRNSCDGKETFDLKSDLDAQGIAKLSADATVLAEKDLQGPLPEQPQDGLQVGRDTGAAVGIYVGPFPFNGEIESATLQLP